MKVMKRDINFGLLLIIIATLVCFSAFTVYYQTTFKNLSTNYYTKLDEIDAVTNQLTLEKGRLNQTSYQLQVKEQRESELSSIYSNLRSEKEQIEDDLKATQDKLMAEKENLREAQKQLSETQAELTSTRSDLDDALSKISSLKDEIDALEDEIAGLCECS